MNTVVYGTQRVTCSAERNAQLVHKRMLAVVLRARPGSILEVGAGKGELGAAFAEHGISYMGIEPVKAEMEEAKRRHPSLNVIQASCYDDPEELRLKKFDLVYSNDVIEHLYEPRRLVAFSRAHIRPGGKVICGTPHYGSYWRNLLLSLTNRWDHHHDPSWDGGHIKFFSRTTLEQMWAEQGFTDFVWGSIRLPRVPLVPMYLYFTATLPT